MESLSFALNATLPIVFTVLIGYLLKRMGILSREFAKQANKLVFRIFLPATLFMNVYSIEDLTKIDLGYVLYSSLATMLIFAVGIPIAIIVTSDPKRRGPLLQSFFRSNQALIGIPLSELLCPGGGTLAATLLSAVMIPIYNVLAVVSLTIFGGGDENTDNEQKVRPRVGFYIKKVILGILKNPLILSIAAGFAVLGIRAVLRSMNIGFAINEVPAIWKTLSYLSSLATPLALLSLGADFEFSAISGMKKELITGTCARVAVAPLLALGVAAIFFRNVFTSGQFAALLALFCTPVAVSSVPMTQEMNGDAELAGQIVLFTTALSAITIFLASFLLKELGIFS